MTASAAPLEAGSAAPGGERLEALIRVRRLSHTYLQGTPLETPALHGIDLDVAAGEIVGVVGPTGSGKSTLLQHLNALLRPQAGDVFVNGVSLSNPRADVRSIRQQVGLLFQSPEDQLFERFAGDDVAFGPRNLGLSADAVRERVRQAMEMVGLPFEYKDRLTTELSQGERRRLALAGVLALQPQVLVLDEPTAGLDPRGRQDLLQLLSRWHQSPGRAMVLATHNMEDIAELCTHVYVLREGAVILYGTTRQVFGQCELLAQMGLALPIAAEAIYQLRKRGHTLPATALTAAEAAAAIEALIHG